MLKQPSLEVRTNETEIALLKWGILDAEKKGWRFDRIICAEYCFGELDNLLLANSDYLEQLHEQNYRFCLFHTLDSEGSIISLTLMAAVYVKKEE